MGKKNNNKPFQMEEKEFASLTNSLLISISHVIFCTCLSAFFHNFLLYVDDDESSAVDNELGLYHCIKTVKSEILIPKLKVKIQSRCSHSVNSACYWSDHEQQIQLFTWMAVLPRSRPDSTRPACSFATRGSSTFMKYRTSFVTSTCQSEPKK